MKKIFIVSLLAVFPLTVGAQRTNFTAADYARAEKMLGHNTALLVDRAGVRPTFLPDGRFWYRVLTPTGSEFVLINPTDGARTTADTFTKLGITPAPGAQPAGRQPPN